MHAGCIFSEGGRTYDLIFPIPNSPFNSCNFLVPQAMTCTFRTCTFRDHLDIAHYFWGVVAHLTQHEPTKHRE